MAAATASSTQRTSSSGSSAAGGLEGDERGFGQPGAADLDDVADDLDAKAGQDRARDRPGGDARRRLARTGALEDVTQVVAAIFQSAGQVRVPWTWPRHGGTPGAGQRLVGLGLDAHRVPPVVPVLVPNLQRDGAAERLAAADAGQDLRAIPLDRHSPAAAVSELPAAEIGIEHVGSQRETGGHPFDDHDKCGTVRFAGRKKSKHAPVILSKFLQCPGGEPGRCTRFRGTASCTTTCDVVAGGARSHTGARRASRA